MAGRNISILLSTLIALSLLPGCGKKGPLVYPDLLVPEAPKSVEVQQSENLLLLSFGLPAKDMSGRKLKESVKIRIQRRELGLSEQGECGTCPTDYLSFSIVDPEFPGSAVRSGERISLFDPDVRIGKRYQYRLVAVDRDGAIGAAAESVRTAVAVPPPAPELQARSLHGGYVLLEIRSELPPDMKLEGYNIYRASGDEPFAFQPIATLKTGDRYEDNSVQRGVRYRYAARVIARRGDKVISSSAMSRQVELSLSDDSK